MRRSPTILALIAVMAVVACGDAQRRHDRRWLKDLTPAPLGVERPHAGEPRTAKIRVYADEDFRAQRVQWRREIQEQIDSANQLLIPALGVQLEAVAIEPWEQRSANRALGAVLTDLEAKDDADDVAWVVGMVSSLSIVSVGFDQLGVARPLGRHLLLRGHAEQEERRDFQKYLPTLSEAEREWLYETRRNHKLTTLFVHEIAHTLGAPHELEQAWVMHPSYHIGVATLSEHSRKLMSVTLDGWLAQPHEPVGVTAARLLSFVEKNPWGGWHEDEAEELRLALQQLATATPPPGKSEGGRDFGVPPAASEQLAAARLMARRGQFAEALAELDALIAAYPSAPELRAAVCELRLAKDGAGAATAIAACDRALEVAPADPRPIFLRIEAHLIAGEVPAALALLPRAEEVAGDDPLAWQKLAALYQSQGMISATERALERAAAPADHPVRGWASRQRARYGLPPGGKVPVADEGAYIATVRQILDLVYASKFPEAEAKAKQAERRWPRTPGILGARCDLALRRGSAATAAKLCDQAIRLWSGAAWAQYLRGVIHLQRGKSRPAIEALRAAIAAEPELSAAYRTLAKAYDLAGDAAARATLDAEYQQRFGSRLPP